MKDNVCRLKMTKRYIRELANDMIKDGHDSEAVERVLNYSEQGLISKYECITELAGIIEKKRYEWMNRFNMKDFIVEDVMDEDDNVVSYYLWATDKLVQIADETRITYLKEHENINLNLNDDRCYNFYVSVLENGSVKLWFDVYDESADDDYDDYEINISKEEEKLIKSSIDFQKRNN